MAERRRALRERLHGLLPADAHLVWELGCGHGHFLTAYAEAHPDQLCVGIDIVGDRIDRANRKRDRAHLANLHFLLAEGRLFLEELPAGARFAEVFILFPDPWPKLRHHKHRIVQPDFLAAVAQRAEPSARLCFRTDFAPYFEDAHATIDAHPDWRVVDEPWPFEQETVFQSRAPSYRSLVARPHPFSHKMRTAKSAGG
ncbi:MAG: tRNA (guanosine(46)-N7)-methyltransferase TrmB [Verrucomicrobia bacterium]|nr:tRNA (guanosine(46)-N7)-methyltransferase TrmB [Verrucomicrobiota bacterium]